MKVYARCGEVIDDPEDILYNVSKLAGVIKTRFNVSYEAAQIVAKWYIEEGAVEDFDSLDEFLEFMVEDLPDMIDSSLDADEGQIVADQFGIDVSFLD